MLKIKGFKPALLLAIIALVACDNELKVNADFKDVTVIYTALQAEKDVNWVRVERGYLGNEPAENSFNEPDSLYYPVEEISVFLREYEPGASRDEISREAPLMVDTGTFDLLPGTFTTQGHRLYRTPPGFTLNTDREYEVVVERKDGTEAFARTGLLEQTQLLNPNGANPNPAFQVFDGSLTWRSVDDASLHEVKIVFKYREFNTRTGEIMRDSVSFEYRDISPSTSGDRRSIETEFINRVANAGIEPNPDLLRFTETVRIEVWSVGEELFTFMQLNQPISGVNQNRPDFPQVTNGTGVVSSRSRYSLEVFNFDNKLINNLITASSACDLRFADIRQQGRDTCICAGNGTVRCL